MQLFNWFISNYEWYYKEYTWYNNWNHLKWMNCPTIWTQRRCHALRERLRCERKTRQLVHEYITEIESFLIYDKVFPNKINLLFIEYFYHSYLSIHEQSTTEYVIHNIYCNNHSDNTVLSIQLVANNSDRTWYQT